MTPQSNKPTTAGSRARRDSGGMPTMIAIPSANFASGGSECSHSHAIVKKFIDWLLQDEIVRLVVVHAQRGPNRSSLAYRHQRGGGESSIFGWSMLLRAPRR